MYSHWERPVEAPDDRCTRPRTLDRCDRPPGPPPKAAASEQELDCCLCRRLRLRYRCKESTLMGSASDAGKCLYARVEEKKHVSGYGPTLESKHEVI